LEIKEDFDAEFYESAFINARNCYKILLDLKEQTLKKEQEYIYLESILNKNIRYLKELISNRLKFANLNSKIDFFTKVNRWINNTEKSFKDNYNFSIEEIKQIIIKSESYIKNYDIEIEKTLKVIINSQIRVNIAQYLVKILNLFFYKLIDSGYFEKDIKKSYFIIMENKLSEKLQIYIEPDKQNILNYKIKLESDNKDIDIKLIKEILKNFKILN
jgi:hypothetical protein